MLRREYDVIVIPNDNATIEVSATEVTPGDTVKLTVTPHDGYILLNTVVTDAGGAPVYVSEDGSFRMPNGSVSVSTLVKPIVYTITFIAGGKTIAVYEFKHGEEVVPPAPPVLAADDTYSYTFSNWSPEIGVALSDMTYEAVYTSELLPEDIDDGSPKMSPKVAKLIKLAKIAVGVFLGLVVLVIVIIVMIKKRRRGIKDGTRSYNESVKYSTRKYKRSKDK